jgi:hypothetical protein
MPEPAGNRSDGRSEPTPASREEPAGLLAALQAGERTRRLDRNSSASRLISVDQRSCFVR